MTLQRILLFLSWSILFLHSIVPHTHHDEYAENHCEASAEEPADLLDLITLLLHFDNGENHLEDFRAGTDTYDLFLLPSYSIIRPFSSPVQTETPRAGNAYCLLEPHRSSESLRAPPF
jgi:hypothetical protein